MNFHRKFEAHKSTVRSRLNEIFSSSLIFVFRDNNVNNNLDSIKNSHCQLGDSYNI